MLIKIGAAFIATILVVLAAPSWGDFNRDAKRCQNDKVRPLVRIKSCTRLILSKRLDKSNLALIYIARGNGYDDGGEIDRAIADYDESIRLNPGNSAAYFNRGFVYSKSKDRLELAVRDFTKAIGLNPGDASAFQSRGITFGKLGQWDRAITDYNQALRLRPDNASSFYNRGIAYDEKGETDLAIKGAGALSPELALERLVLVLAG